MDIIEHEHHQQQSPPDNNDDDNNNNDITSIAKMYESSLQDTTTDSDDNNQNSTSFDCNICFDSAHDPIVTLCGHLYCWACIFKWLNVHQTSGSDPGVPVQQQACPVCKASISQASLIPLYCHGPSPTPAHDHKNPATCDFIPPRPSVHRLPHSNHRYLSSSSSDPFQAQFLPFHHHHYLPSYPPYDSNYATLSSTSNLVSTTIAGIINPTIGFLGELVYTRMFGSSNASLFSYPVPSSYAALDHNSSRTRRQEVYLDRVFGFFLCCCILCWLLF